MLRWHTSPCTNPLISTDEFGVSCRSCSTTYLFNQQSVPPNTAANLDIPKDRPLGQLRIRWPPSISFTSGERLDDAHESSGSLHGQSKTMRYPEHPSEDAAHVMSYSQLDVGQFRLACLNPAKTQTSLIHLGLERYDMGDCPEYEAISYSWGGEDGDDKPSGPIFLGKFYDVAFQTKNCLAMLKYLRPSRNIRMVWIDAICIDQSNTRERGMQVAEMRNVYHNANRVVVYLGPETVLQSSQQYRRRKLFHEFDAFQKEDHQAINKLFNHRYFSRVWVIQELLLAKSLLVPMGDSDYSADSTTMKQLDIDWKSTKAPWFQHITNGRIVARDELLPWLEQIWGSEASDPRDKLFGTLGLVNTEPPIILNSVRKVDYSLLPDYDLSTQEIFIGFVAYVVVVLNQWHILERAAGLKAAPGYPSWTPARLDPLIWSAPMIAKQDDFDRVRPWYEDMGLCCKTVWTIASGFPDKDVEWRCRIVSHGTESSQGSWGAKDFRQLRTMMTMGNAANEQISIHSSTAALSIKLVRIIQLSARPRRVADLGSLRMFEFIMAQWSLLLCTALIDLDLILDNAPTWIFLRDVDDETGPTVFFLREVHPAVEDTTYELIYCCRCWDLLIFRRPEQTDNRDSAKAGLHRGNSTHRLSTLNFRHARMKMDHAKDCFHIPLYGRKASWGKPLPYETLYAATSIINVDAIAGRELLLGFPATGLRVNDVLPFLQLLVDANLTWQKKCQQLGERYMSMVSQFSSVTCSTTSPCHGDFARQEVYHYEAKPWKDYGSIYLTIDAATWATYKKLWGPRGEYGTARGVVLVNQKITKVTEAESEAVCKWTGWSRLGSFQNGWMAEHVQLDSEATIYLRIPLSEIARYMKKQELAKRFFNLTKFRHITGWDETTMVQNIQHSHRGIFTHPWPNFLREEIGLIGEPCRIQIV